MIISEEEFFDYIDCPVKYEMKHIAGIEIKESKSVNKLILPVVGYFFASIFNGKVASIDSLKKRWDNICEKNIDYIDGKKNLQGIGTLINLHRYAEDRKLIVADIGSGYNIDTKNNKLVGFISNPIIKNEDSYELLVPYLSNRYPNAIELDTKLKYSIEAYGFEKSFAQRLELINVALINKGKEYYTSRTYLDYERLKFSIDGVCKGIANKVFYPRESAFCESCDARALCRYWKGYEE